MCAPINVPISMLNSAHVHANFYTQKGSKIFPIEGSTKNVGIQILYSLFNVKQPVLNNPPYQGLSLRS